MNGRLDNAELEAILTGDQRAIDKQLLIGQQEIFKRVDGMAQVCEERGKLCPIVCRQRRARRTRQVLIGVIISVVSGVSVWGITYSATVAADKHFQKAPLVQQSPTQSPSPLVTGPLITPPPASPTP